MKRKRKPGIAKVRRLFKIACPRCGGHWKVVSGFHVCVDCGHRSDPPLVYPDNRPRGGAPHTNRILVTPCDE